MNRRQFKNLMNTATPIKLVPPPEHKSLSKQFEYNNWYVESFQEEKRIVGFKNGKSNHHFELSFDNIDDFREPHFVDLRCKVLVDGPQIGFEPITAGSSFAPPKLLPLTIDFEGGRDDLRIKTPPLAHRRLFDGGLEFGNLYDYSQSWASIGDENVSNFHLSFRARFSKVNAEKPDAWSYIGIAFRSQHFLANYTHLLYLKHDGHIVLTEAPDNPIEGPPHNYLRGATPIDHTAYHYFEVLFNESILRVQVDDVSHAVEVARMGKVLGPGLLMFQAFCCWMVIRQVKVTDEAVE